MPPSSSASLVRVPVGITQTCTGLNSPLPLCLRCVWCLGVCFALPSCAVGAVAPGRGTGRPHGAQWLPEECDGGDGSGVPSGAASSGTSSITCGHLLPPRSLEWFGLSAGGVPKTDHASLAHKTGGDPRTDHASLVTASFTTDKSGDPRTDHSLCTTARVGSNSPRLGGLATQTANIDPDSPGLNPDLADFRGFDHEAFAGFSHSEIPEVHDELPSYGVLQGHVHSQGSLLDRLFEKRFMNSSSDCTSTAFFAHFTRCGKVRASPPVGFQSSKVARQYRLSTHQMGEPLAGTSGQDRVDGAPFQASLNSGSCVNAPLLYG